MSCIFFFATRTNETIFISEPLLIFTFATGLELFWLLFAQNQWRIYRHHSWRVSFSSILSFPTHNMDFYFPLHRTDVDEAPYSIEGSSSKFGAIHFETSESPQNTLKSAKNGFGNHCPTHDVKNDPCRRGWLTLAERISTAYYAFPRQCFALHLAMHHA
ncbi:hypothetical protein [Variovorax rhizosphaerae]|uniref:Uncharacterized protein n=1 Tax=Variovorax rhizosphaerae TaxID=1836200 RepID=A0ABU8WX08_9BURK